MLISEDQNRRFWREWNAIVVSKKWTRPEAEKERKAMLARAGFTSLTLVDKVKGFTRVLTELAALRDDLGGMVRADQNDRRVLYHNIWQVGLQLCSSKIDSMPFGNSYIGKVMADKFGTRDASNLTDEQLKQLLFTLTARAAEQRRIKKLATVGATGNNPW